MNIVYRGILLIVGGLLFFQTNVFAVSPENDSIVAKSEIQVKKHYPSKATMYSAVLPGLGQIYNRQYLKTPFILAGIGGLTYVVQQYNKLYINNKKAYFDLNDNNPNTKAYETIYPKYDYSIKEKYSEYSEGFKQNIDYYRNKRDLFIIITAGFYLLNILDANVGAHFIDFDIDENLTVNIRPFMIEPICYSPVLGANVSLTF